LRQWQFIWCQMTSSKEVSWLCCCILKENAEKIVLEIDIFPMIMAAFSDNVKVTSQAWGLLKTATGPLQEALQANWQKSLDSGSSWLDGVNGILMQHEPNLPKQNYWNRRAIASLANTLITVVEPVPMPLLSSMLLLQL
jgi:hypothetical protein